MDKLTKRKTVALIFKEGLFAVMYLLLMCPTGLLIMLIPKEYSYLTILASLANIAFFVLIAIMFYRNVGAEHMKTWKSNQVLYKNQDKLSDGVRIETEKEFAAYKGFTFGAVSVMPLLFLMLIYAILHIAGVNPMSFGGVIKTVYVVFWSLLSAVVDVKSFSAIYLMLPFIIIPPISTAVGYILGGLKAKRQLNAIEDTKKAIYGGANITEVTKLNATRNAIYEKNVPKKYKKGKKK